MKALDDALTGLSDGSEDTPEGFYRAADVAVRQAWSQRPGSGTGVTWDTPLGTTFGLVAGDKLKALRNEAGWTQERLAGVMDRLGFDWKRITCAQVENGSRRMGLDEMAALAALFAVPAIEFLLPEGRSPVEIAGDEHAPAVVRELLLGRGGSVGSGGLNWRPPLDVLGDLGKEERPAVDLWNARRAAEGGTP